MSEFSSLCSEKKKKSRFQRFFHSEKKKNGFNNFGMFGSEV